MGNSSSSMKSLISLCFDEFPSESHLISLLHDPTALYTIKHIHSTHNYIPEVVIKQFSLFNKSLTNAFIHMYIKELREKSVAIMMIETNRNIPEGPEEKEEKERI